MRGAKDMGEDEIIEGFKEAYTLSTACEGTVGLTKQIGEMRTLCLPGDDGGDLFNEMMMTLYKIATAATAYSSIACEIHKCRISDTESRIPSVVRDLMPFKGMSYRIIMAMAKMCGDTEVSRIIRTVMEGDGKGRNRGKGTGDGEDGEAPEDEYRIDEDEDEGDSLAELIRRLGNQ